MTRHRDDPVENPHPHDRVANAVRRADWTNADVELRGLEQFLWRAIEASADAYDLWEGELEARFGDDPAAISSDDLVAMDPEMRLAYVGYLIRCVAILYGVHDGRSLEARPGSLAELLRELNDIHQLPVISDRS